ncbi:hypothetical protein GGQ88_003711 [Novosphingobium hassiacum]|uniref:Uncharacterized protein n=1 Tax=Novosphingobium hassiacum TaxID=173676 RepID=A0A7W6EXL4_9SPHN|nr:hypothetical protein [Novosphingobium hassiacum]
MRARQDSATTPVSDLSGGPKPPPLHIAPDLIRGEATFSNHPATRRHKN